MNYKGQSSERRITKKNWKEKDTKSYTNKPRKAMINRTAQFLWRAANTLLISTLCQISAVRVTVVHAPIWRTENTEWWIMPEYKRKLTLRWNGLAVYREREASRTWKQVINKPALSILAEIRRAAIGENEPHSSATSGDNRLQTRLSFGTLLAAASSPRRQIKYEPS